MDIATIAASVGKLADITYTCRDIGYGVESGTIAGLFTGTIDPWGKWSVVSNRQSHMTYLFADEIDSIAIMDIEAVIQVALGRTFTAAAD